MVLYALVIFTAGAITGAFVAPYFGRSFIRPPRPGEISHHLMEHLRTALNLTDAQTAQIRPLVEKTGADLEQIRRDTTQRVRHRLDEANTQIMALLNPQQQIALRKLEAKHRDRMRHSHDFGEPPPPDQPPPDR